MARTRGRRTWIFPDTELPPAGDSLLKGRESIIILNLNRRPARVALTLFFTDARQVNLAYYPTMGYSV